MTMMTHHSLSRTGGAGVYRRLLGLADRVPLSLVQLVSRLAVAQVFWHSSQAKLASWPVTVQLFTFEYRLPVIDPGVAAVLATTAEVSGSILLACGLFSRLASLMLLCVTATIQIFVYPGNWSEHLTWAAPLLLILVRGAGAVSIDHLAARRFLRER